MKPRTGQVKDVTARIAEIAGRLKRTPKKKGQTPAQRRKACAVYQKAYTAKKRAAAAPPPTWGVVVRERGGEHVAQFFVEAQGFDLVTTNEGRAHAEWFATMFLKALARARRRRVERLARRGRHGERRLIGRDAVR